MSGKLFCLLFVVSIVAFSGCRERKPTKDIVMIVNLVNNPQKIKEYKQYHKHIWPEVEEGFRKAGFDNIRVYQFDRHLVMIVTIPADANLSELSKKAEAYDPRCKEWNQLMDKYQQGVDGALPGQKWAEMKKIYDLSKE
jgi:L-rhamnose mutarotase